MKRIFSVIVLLITTSVINLAAATEQQIDFIEQLEQSKSRLQLSDKQAEQIEPVLMASFERIQQVLAKYDIDLSNGDKASGSKLGFRKARKLGKEIKQIRADTLTELSQYLTEQQLDEYEKIQQERKQAMREKFKNRNK